MIRRTHISTLTDTLVPYSTRFRSPGDQRLDREDRGQGIGEDVHIGGAQVVVLAVSVGRTVLMVVAVMVAAREQRGADDIDRETDDREDRRLAKGDVGRVDEANRRYERDAERSEARRVGKECVSTG